MTNTKGFETYLKESWFSDKTVETYVRTVKLLLRKYPDDLIKGIKNKKISASTRQTYRAALKQWADFTNDEELMREIDSKDLQRTLKKMHRGQASNAQATQPFTNDEIASILEALDEWAYNSEVQTWVWPSLRLLIKLGLRAGVDLACIERKAVKKAIDNEEVLIISTKGEELRNLPISTVLEELEILYAHKDWEILADLIAPYSQPKTRTDAAYDAISRYLKAAAQKAGIDPSTVHPHRFRHTAAHQLFEKTHDLMLVRDFLGHKSVSTTEKYLKSNRTSRLNDVLKDEEA